MKTLSLVTTVTPGAEIEHVILEAKLLSERFGIGIRFKFNDVYLTIWHDSDVQERIRVYHELVSFFRENAKVEKETILIDDGCTADLFTPIEGDVDKIQYEEEKDRIAAETLKKAEAKKE